jgi:coenzyme Q-binding protein COQ10
MPTHSETKILKYKPEQMFDLVADVNSYPKFLPWCSAARIHSRNMIDKNEILEADLVISFKVFREKFASKVTLIRSENQILTEYIDGPFKRMHSTWHFKGLECGSEVSFYVDFEMKNAVLQKIVGVVFNEAMQRVLSAFENQAKALYID